MRHSRATLAALALAATLALPLAADDRDLLRPSGAEPYVFVLFDVSGSMHWTPQCTAEQVAAGTCELRCDGGDCFAPLNGDDPASKLYQAKEALFEVVQGLSGVHLGFGTYNQDALRVRGKHWLYRATSDGVALPGGQLFPRNGDQDVFGAQWACNGGNATGCAAASPADLGNAWARQRMLRLPKLGDGNDSSRVFFVRTGGTTFRMTYAPAAGTTLGAVAFAANVTAERCNNATCSSRTLVSTRRVDYALVDQFLSWDLAPSTAAVQTGYFNQGDAADVSAGNTCAGWDPNDDTAADPYSGYALRWPTAGGGPYAPWLDEGDVVPLDWRDTHKGEVLRRLSPAGTLAPDFGSAGYFENRPRGGEAFLRLLSEARRPLLGSGSTPLGASVADFRTWYAGCAQGQCHDGEPGWDDLARVQDSRWACRKKYLIVVTDGDDTCGGGGAGGSACSSTASLCAQESVKTFVVAFGVPQGNGANALTCMAANGGSREPIYPQNKGELVDALDAIFSEIVEESRSFASAAVPTVQANAADKIYLTHFNPVQGEAIWDGHLDAYLKPLPLVDGVPDRARTCAAGRTAGCRLWDAGAVLLGQAPTRDEVANDQLRLGLTTTTRRVFHARANGSLRLFEPPVAAADWDDLFTGLGVDPAAVAADPAAARARVEAIVGQTLVRKEARLERPDGSVVDVEYVLGDLFHSDPQIVESPSDFQRFATDFAPGEPASAEPCRLDDEGDDTHPGYRCFAFRHQFRRKMVAVGGNDGMLHLFDAGTYVPRPGRPASGTYTHGTGLELAALVPRMLLPVIRDQAEETDHVYGLDGTLKPTDVFIDPDGNGDAVTQWRTVLVSGLREGGKVVDGSRVEVPEGSGEPMRSGYFAVDVTQPDELQESAAVFVPRSDAVVPTCLSLDGLPKDGCGPLPFPAILWEFHDASALAPFDQDGNGHADLAETWSEPVVGPIRVEVDGAEQTRWVAIVGGGVTSAGKLDVDPQSGNFVYMIDMETGRAIWKREVEGQVPEVAAVDADQDQYIDTLYFGTTVGRMYKVDVATAGVMEDVAQRDLLGAETTRRMVTDGRWSPFVIFRAGDDLPIFQRPTTFFVGNLSATAIAFGTGDREELWSRPPAPGRFYVLLDERFSRGDATLPRTEANYLQVTSDGGAVGSDVFVNPPAGLERGWFLRLGDPANPDSLDERVITEAFGLAGVIVFSSFDPHVEEPEEGQGRPVCGGGNGNGNGNGDDGAEEQPLCARTGRSKSFVVYAFNGDPIVDLGNAANGTGADRYSVVEDFVSNPFVEQAHSQNVGETGQPLSGVQEAIMRRLQELYPPNTRFGNYWLMVRQVLGSTGVRDIASIPIGVVLKNWKEL